MLLRARLYPHTQFPSILSKSLKFNSCVRGLRRGLRLPSAEEASSSVTAVLDEYRENVGVCIVNRDGLVFAAQRCDDVASTWQMPQGGVDEGEEPHVAALREVAEETSMKSVRIIGELVRWLTYDFPTKVRKEPHGGWQHFKGQKQKFFLVYFYGDDSEINLHTEHQEFKEWAWMELADLPGSVVEFKREVYSEVAKDFIPLIKQLIKSGEIPYKSDI